MGGETWSGDENHPVAEYLPVPAPGRPGAASKPRATRGASEHAWGRIQTRRNKASPGAPRDCRPTTASTWNSRDSCEGSRRPARHSWARKASLRSEKVTGSSASELFPSVSKRRVGTGHGDQETAPLAAPPQGERTRAGVPNQAAAVARSREMRLVGRTLQRRVRTPATRIAWVTERKAVRPRAGPAHGETVRPRRIPFPQLDERAIWRRA